MPVKKVKGGYRWGSKGKVYTGSGAKSKAARQGQAAHASGYRDKSRVKRRARGHA